MNISSSNSINTTSFRGKIIPSNLSNKVANKFASMNEIGEGMSITCDFLGKAVVVPLVIMAASSESKENKEYSALKNPVAALIQLAFEVPILAFGSKFVENLADKGAFDVIDGEYSYNVKSKQKDFRRAILDNKDKFKEAKRADEFIETLDTKGYCKKVVEDFKHLIDGMDSTNKEQLQKAFDNFEKTYKNTFHLKNRLCFVAALALTPLLCALEDVIHPKVMSLIYSKRTIEKETIKKTPRKHYPDIVDFARNARKAGGI